jgi:hypothetical protein
MLPRILLLSVLALLTACANLGTSSRPAEPAPPSNEEVQAALLAGYVSALQTVVQGSPAEQAEVLAEARENYEMAGRGPAVLRYALLLATPGHPAHDPGLAQRLLRETLARPELLSPIERALAIVETERVRQELELAAENERLVAEAQQERDRQRNVPSSAALAKRLQEQSNENTRLRRELDEAKAKLDAIANIERNVPDRQPANEARKP